MTFSGTDAASAGGVLAGGPEGGLVRAADLVALRSRLEDFVAAGTSSLSDAERVDVIRAAEELSCTLGAVQAALAASLDESVQAERAARGVAPHQRGRGVAEQVAHARRESPHRGRRHLGLARIVAAELPHAWAAWCAGRVGEWTVSLIAQETACLPLEHRLAVDELVAADADALEAMSPHEVRGRCRAAAERLDPSAVLARRRHAESERRVSIRPAPDTMTWVTALLPVKDGVGVYAALTRAVDAARASGDPRTRGQVMADALVEAALRQAGGRGGTASGSGTASDAPTPVAGVGVQLHLVMSDTALFGGADEGARLEGYGPLPAELAREIVCGTLDAEESVWVRRLVTDPVTGSLVAYDPRARRFPATLARLVRLRDGVCRTPWCGAPVRHVDHAVPYAEGGPTSFVNAQGLCEGCNYAKQADGWHTALEADATVVTTLPTGHRYATRPPLIATIRPGAPPLRIDYVLTG